MDDPNDPMDQILPAEGPVTPPPATTVHVAPPPPRKTSSYLLLGVNLLILVFAVVWVWSRMQNGDVTDPALAAEGGNAADIRSGIGADGVERVVEMKSYDRDLPTPGSGLQRRKRGALVPDRTFTSAASRDIVDEGPVVAMTPETQAALAATERNIDTVGVELEVVRAIKGAYPSSTEGDNPDSGANRGIEALYQALMDAGRTSVEQMPTGDTDGDGRTEILDSWGNPLVYFNALDYAAAGQGWGAGADGITSKVSRRQTGDGRAHAEERFQIWSAGPNGVNDDGRLDDITSWVIRE